ncbi:MAG: hypothetical protein NTV29_13810 [Planctomycetota bacterium]|nr:hypothetical protein [Planctomycetota bacterium]
MLRCLVCLLAFGLGSSFALAQDWLVDPAAYQAKAELQPGGRELVLSNGLIERRIALVPNAATIGFRNLMTGETILRGIKPEATVELDGQRYDIGGLQGQPNYAFLDPSWLASLKNDPGAFQYQGHEIRPSILPRMEWKQTRHHAPNTAWPPKGIELVLRFAKPGTLWSQGVGSDQGRSLLWEDSFENHESNWKNLTALNAKNSDPQTLRIENAHGGLILTGPVGRALLLERPVPQDAGCVEVAIDPIDDQDTSWGPGLALVCPDGAIEVNLRPGDRGEHGHFELRNQGRETLVKVPQFAAQDNGIERTCRYALRVRWQEDQMIWDVAQLKQPSNSPVDTIPSDSVDPQRPADQRVYHKLFQIPWNGIHPTAVRIGKSDRSGNPKDNLQATTQDPSVPKRTQCGFYDFRVYSKWDKGLVEDDAQSRLRVDVHYELYDGLPAYGKWITIENSTPRPVRVDRYCSDVLAAVEHTSEVDALSVGLTPPNLHIETEMAFGGMTSQGANRRSYRWVADPDYHTQVNYEKKTPCLLEIGPDLGPAQTLPAGQSWSSYRGWVLVHDSFDRERSGLAVRKLFRCIAPWVTENPLMMHLIASDEASVLRAIEQCHEVGFEMLILSFGSGFNLESQSGAMMEKAQKFAAAAKAKNIEIGSYSLLASRSISVNEDVVMPEGQKPTFGNSPCLESSWGNEYFARLYEFHRNSGFTLLEHDGSYPGDPCKSQLHPGHQGLDDSRWNQWETIAEFYRWCREEGLFLNVPDHYFLVGSNKTGMGYREVNWSLPREQQTIHTRQNIYDGTWQKTPSMGWMFVPLTEYHGGGPAATIEPLDKNIDHYRNMIQSNLGLGVQACYRGPRLYDTDRVKQMVKQQVAWYKQHRDILESDLIHGRRPDASGLDWCLHVNPQLTTQGMLVVYNPTSGQLRERLKVPMHYTGLRERVDVRQTRADAPLDDKTLDHATLDNTAQTMPISPQEILELEVLVPAYSMRSYTFEKSPSR